MPTEILGEEGVLGGMVVYERSGLAHHRRWSCLGTRGEGLVEECVLIDHGGLSVKKVFFEGVLVLQKMHGMAWQGINVVLR